MLDRGLATVQCKIFKGCKIAVSLQKAKIISAKMNGQLVTCLNYACNHVNAIFCEITIHHKFIAHKIICAVWVGKGEKEIKIKEVNQWEELVRAMKMNRPSVPLYYVYTGIFLWPSTGQPSLFDSVNSDKTELK